jgi:hypothetical protein
MPVADVTFDRKGSTWICEASEWPVMLIARNAYMGTQRVLATLTLARSDRQPPLGILTERIDLLVHAQVARFAKEATARMADSDAGAAKMQRAIETMLDALQERLLDSHGELIDLAADEIEIPDDLTPAYAVWPFVPVARAGLLIGARGQGKSTMVKAAGLSIITGHRIVPHCEPRIQGPVLYIGQEEDPEQWTKSLEQICRGLGIARPHAYRYLQLTNSSLIDSAERVAETAAKHGAVLVIVDSAQATWGNGTEAAVREYATTWFHAVKQIGVPTWVIEHPNRNDTKSAGGDREAAGTSVKGDRAGHQWSLDSIELPHGEDDPIRRYHVTLTDTKRSYVAKQPDITYATIFYRYDWVKFEEADALTADTVVESSRLFRQLASTMRQGVNHEAGWTLAELTKALGQKSDARIRTELRTADLWRISPDGGFAEHIVKGKGGGVGRGNAARYVLETKQREMPSAPGDGDGYLQ